MHGPFKGLNGKLNLDAQCPQASALVVYLVPNCNNARKENTMKACHETKGWMKKMELMQRLFSCNQNFKMMHLIYVFQR